MRQRMRAGLHACGAPAVCVAVVAWLELGVVDAARLADPAREDAGVALKPRADVDEEVVGGGGAPQIGLRAAG